MAVEDMISGQSTDISERIERLEMQMNKLQVNFLRLILHTVSLCTVHRACNVKICIFCHSM